jgi:DNA invertase Pin-like site-specific DNA recombinase
MSAFAPLFGLAEFERELIRKRYQAGIECARAKGTKFPEG